MADLVADGEVVTTVDSGILVVRRHKHEPLDLTGLNQSQVLNRTDKRSGSKFLEGWNTQKIADWASKQIELAGWRPGKTHKLDVHYDFDIGISSGRRVRTIRLVSDGQRAHAYPERP